MKEENHDHFDPDDIEATGKEFHSVCYTGICLVALLVIVIGCMIFTVLW